MKALRRLDSLDRFADLGPLTLRVLTAGILIYGVQDNVFSGEHMRQFEVFLEKLGTPSPAVAARVSVYAQLLCGLAILLGFAARWAGLVMVINFVTALYLAHRNLPWNANIAPTAMLGLSLYFVFAGSGRWSLDQRR